MYSPSAVLGSSYWVFSGYLSHYTTEGGLLLHAYHIQWGWRGAFIHYSRMWSKNQTISLFMKCICMIEMCRWSNGVCLSSEVFMWVTRSHCTGSVVCSLQLSYQTVYSTVWSSSPGWRSCLPTEMPITAHCIVPPNGPAVAEGTSGLNDL